MLYVDDPELDTDPLLNRVMLIPLHLRRVHGARATFEPAPRFGPAPTPDGVRVCPCGTRHVSRVNARCNSCLERARVMRELEADLVDYLRAAGKIPAEAA